MVKSYLWGLILLTAMVCMTSCSKNLKSTQDLKTRFTIVTDSITYDRVQSQIESYKDMLEDEGMEVLLVSKQWGKPEQIRKHLKKIYNESSGLEGAVFIGDVPIPMIMDAQHLTTAYKRNQERYPLHVAAVPSDRYYDDFDLKFSYIGKDSIRPLNHYYRLSPESTQYVDSDIYTARIKPSVKDGEDKYQLIGNYLDKVVENRSQIKLDHIMSFTGHGYNSESLTSWTGEKIALREQFPEQFKAQGNVEFLDFRMDEFMKPYLLSKLQDDQLDMALLHEHGASDMQYLSGYPKVSSVNASIDNIKRYLRSKIRTAKRRGKDLSQTKKRYVDYYDVPYKWFDGAFSPNNIKKDSIFNRNMDVYLQDMENIQSNARFIMFDACFNGSFHHDRYVAGEYVFGDGKTTVAHGNTVNALQDKWPDEMIGLLGLGVRIGNWAKQINTLETHLIGDPTFHFNVEQDLDYNKVIAAANDHPGIWEKLLEASHPDLQCLALRNLFDAGDPAFSDRLRRTYLRSPSFHVRMECLKLLRFYNDDNYRQVLSVAIDDPYELIRRKAASFIGKSGDDQLIPSLLSVLYEDPYSKRVAYAARRSLDLMDPEAIIEESQTMAQKSNYLLDVESITEDIIEDARGNRDRIQEAWGYMKCDTVADKYRELEIRTLRNYTYHHMVPEYLKLIEDPTFNEELKVKLIEAMGWFTHSYQREKIMEVCRELAKDRSLSEKVQYEAERTLSRINPMHESHQ